MSRKQINLEFIFRASPAIAYKFLTTPSCLIRWFCDSIDIEKDYFTFGWDGAEETAYMVDDIEEERVRFKWEDADDEKEYLEFRMGRSPVTNETILEITDFCDDDEVEYQTKYWQSLMDELRIVMGG